VLDFFNERVPPFFAIKTEASKNTKRQFLKLNIKHPCAKQTKNECTGRQKQS
jgi:hypothetical protein